MEKSSSKNYFTAAPLLWSVSPLDACAVSKQCSRQSWHKRQECLILAKKGPVRTCKITDDDNSYYSWQAHAYILKMTHTHTYARTHAHTHTQCPTQLHTQLHTQNDITFDNHMHTHTHTHTHTNTHCLHHIVGFIIERKPCLMNLE